MGNARLWIVIAELLCAFVWWKATRPDEVASTGVLAGAPASA